MDLARRLNPAQLTVPGVGRPRQASRALGPILRLEHRRPAHRLGACLKVAVWDARHGVSVEAVGTDRRHRSRQVRRVGRAVDRTEGSVPRRERDVDLHAATMEVAHGPRDSCEAAGHAGEHVELAAVVDAE
eukprot:488063-Prymnesium_polylepis.4